MKTTAIAVFAKTPGLSPVKTRLAADIGPTLAEAFFRRSVKVVEQVVLRVKESSNGMVTPWWAVAEEEGVKREIWNKLPSLWTGNGGLGERLATVYRTLMKQYDSVVLMGTDSPQIKPSRIIQAIEGIWERPEGCVLGPSCDGGFYLFGSSKPLPAALWTEVEYSQTDTLFCLMQQLKRLDIPITLLPEEGDVDTGDDLTMLYHSWIKTGEELPEQHQLANWLGSLGIQ